MSEKTIEEVVEAAKAPGTFSIMNVLNERAYPHEDVVIFLDEQSAYEASILNDEIKKLGENSKTDNQDEIDELIVKRDKIIEKLEQSKYVFLVNGISEGMREDLNEEAIKKFPIEYEETKNPISGEITRKEIDSKERNRYFTNLIWHTSIEKITAPDGSIQDNVTFDDVLALRKTLPLAAIGSLTQAIEKLRMSTALFMATVDEDFLAKS